MMGNSKVSGLVGPTLFPLFSFSKTEMRLSKRDQYGNANLLVVIQAALLIGTLTNK